MDGQNEIRLYDAIGDFGLNAEWLASQIPQDAKSVTVRINSPGGAVSDGLAMYHYLKDHPAHVTTVVDGYAASAASIVMLAGDDIRVHRGSIVMIHNPWGGAQGDASDMRHTADVLDEVTEALLDIYEAETGMPRDEIRELLNAETWMRGEAAIEHGLATVLAEDDAEGIEQAAAMSSFSKLIAAIENGDERMSRQKTRKEIEGEFDAQAKALTEANDAIGGHVAEIAALREAAETQSTEHAAAVEDLTGQIASLNDAAEAVAADRVEVEGELSARAEEADRKAEAVAAELIEAQALVEKQKAALADPSNLDALASEFDDKLPGVAADAEADAAEAQASEGAEDEAPQDIADAYHAMAPGAERVAFYSKNRKQIIDALERREG